ncbi:hypothetical protein [Altererythrobacter sp. GH1-8]|uniref:hypothetical protein n=1 Tax=Altererythrobacter sp. GH1-8 TaxID=3349333 RepID=UPI00374D714E
MERDHLEALKDEQRLALAYTPAALRPALEASFALDRRLAQIVSKTTEPMLGQMRLAWWRDMLSSSVAERPTGDAVLDAVSTHWSGREESLVMLVNAWEILVAEDALAGEQIREFGRGRAAPFAMLAASADQQQREMCIVKGTRWALADAAAHICDADERARFVSGAPDQKAGPARLPRSLRGLAVLDALAMRALKAGGRPLMEGRGAALLALRVGLLGR